MTWGSAPSPVGPFDMWPTGSGFEYFYGFIGGETNQYYAALYEGTISAPSDADHFISPEEQFRIAMARQ